MRKGKVNINIKYAESTWRTRIACYYLPLVSEFPAIEIAVHRPFQSQNPTDSTVALEQVGWTVTDPKTGLSLHTSPSGTRADAVTAARERMISAFIQRPVHSAPPLPEKDSRVPLHQMYPGYATG